MLLGLITLRSSEFPRVLPNSVDPSESRQTGRPVQRCTGSWIETQRHPNNPIIVGFQGKAQLEVICGHLTEVMLSQPATSIYLKTKEPDAREWVSKAIAKVEIERLKETHFDGSRSRRNFALDRLQSIGLPSHGRCCQGGEHRLAQPRDRAREFYGWRMGRQLFIEQ
jgi:Type IV secretion-system coupling protein DNA-binding domain